MPPHEPLPLVRRSVTAAGWRFGAQVSAGAILFAQSVLLARLLPIAVFGVFSLALAVVEITQILGTLGLSPALLHRCEETRDVDRAASVHFTLTLALSVVWLVALSGGALLLAPDPYRTALVVLGLGMFVGNLGSTPRTLLVRQVHHGRLSAMQVVSAVLTTVVAAILAWMGMGLWTLLGVELTATAVFVLGLYAWRPVWRPRLVWPDRELRYFLGFGAHVVTGQLLNRGLDAVDRLWTGLFLGDAALGLYSRARLFAGYPRKLIGLPMDAVTSGVYAELKGDRERLSTAFFDANAVLLRAAFCLAGALAVAGPELVTVALGRRWLPMLAALWPLLPFVLLDPVRLTVSQLYVAVGLPGVVARIRLVQLVAMGVGVIGLGSLWGITGVAVAVSLAHLLGTGSLLLGSRRLVDVSLRGLLGAPAVALAASCSVVWLLPLDGLTPDMVRGGVAIAIQGSIYAAILGVAEHRYLRSLVGRLREGLGAHGLPDPTAATGEGPPTSLSR